MPSHNPSKLSSFFASTALRTLHNAQHFSHDFFVWASWPYPALLVSVLHKFFELPSARHCLLGSSVVVFFAVIALIARKCLHKSATSVSSERNSVSVMHALRKLMIPSRSIWPTNYIDSRSWLDQNKRRASLPARALFLDIIQGRIELRRPEENLPLLIKDQLYVDGWCFGLEVDFKDRMKVLAWTVSEEMALVGDVSFSSGSSKDKDLVSPAERSLLLNSCSTHCLEIPSQLTHDADYPRSVDSRWRHRYTGGGTSTIDSNEELYSWPNLDFIPYSSTESFIRSLKKSSVFGPTRRSVLTFTTSEAAPSVFDKKHMLAALFFMRKSSSKGAPARTSAPLYARLHRVLAVLTSGDNALNVLLTQNASVKHARELNEYAERLEYDEEEKTTFIKANGIQAWREERLYARWEAALHNAGLLTRWIVLVEPKKKEQKN